MSHLIDRRVSRQYGTFIEVVEVVEVFEVVEVVEVIEVVEIVEVDGLVEVIKVDDLLPMDGRTERHCHLLSCLGTAKNIKYLGHFS